MTFFLNVETFTQWRDQARALLVSGVTPSEIHFSSDADQPNLFETAAPSKLKSNSSSVAPTVPPAFLEIAKHVACHRDAGRWELLYRTLWRLTHGERHLLEISTDDDVFALNQMKKAVTRDVHKMKAFVRFRKVVAESVSRDNQQHQQQAETQTNYIAWHRPDHRIVTLAAPFFSRRFKAMNWTILTPDESVSWDQRELKYGPGVPVNEAPGADSLEDLWKTYYASIFNPARVKVAMMKREMPVRHWPTLPETELIPELLQQASSRVAEMIANNEGFAETATHYMPSDRSLPSLRAAATHCQACDLHQCATQMVFGEGSPSARIVIVGEQPGDREDIEGRPFVGPAGQLLDDALRGLEIDREDVYITNVVKHFKFTERGKQRLHKKPNSREIFACRPWLEAEIATIRPDTILCLGATPASALFGRDFRVTKQRGEVMATDWCKRTIATWHPAAILRMPNLDRRNQMHQQFVSDLALALDR
ncbi:uracil-DNA glycosylase superfamily protein [Rhodopirellula maiorica SM1]|uniref:Type-4 uracil-DNA glycosylase n=1 Tax=Rhodopirellula maiorica SM1 TaxID=1265738 RepID=M5RB37_9BACT|nr:UdgX family uracil-DNA binding protein [Rhodopirellula maiorica]EMI16266.1 uracil-DNA glycosylase superfamily protein [Rhodopirellula maiorica SM1]